MLDMMYEMVGHPEELKEQFEANFSRPAGR